jgi:hypothetical protein
VWKLSTCGASRPGRARRCRSTSPPSRAPADDKLPKNHRIVREHVEVTRGEHPTTVMTAPKGYTIITIGFGDGGQVAGAVKNTAYAGKRSVRVRLFVNPNKVARGQIGKGTLDLLARRA